MLATTVFGVGYVLRQAQVDAETRAAAAAAERSDAIAEKIKAMVERSLGAVAGARDSLAALHLYDSDRHVADMLLKHLLDTDPIRYGAWTVWKPDAFDGRDKDFAGKMPSDQTGRYLTYWHQDGVTVAMDRVRGYDVADAALFRTPLDGAEAFLSEPYYLIPQSEQPIAVVSYVEPIVVARHSLGAIGIDVEVSPIQDAIAAIARPSDGNVTLVSHGGTVVATTSKELAGTSLAERGNGALAVAFARAEARGAMDEDIAGASGPILRSWRPVSFNSVRTPWYVVSDMPLGAFATDAPLNRVQGAAIVILGIVAAMLAIILLAVRGIVTRPLANIERFIRTLGEEGGDTTCRETARRDEIGSIARTLVAFKASEQEVVRLRRAESAREAEFFAKRRAELHQFADQLARSVQAASHVVEETARLIMQRAKSVADTAVASADRTRVILDASGVADRSVGAVDEAAGALKASISSIVVEMSQARRIAGEAAEQAATSSAVTTELSRSASHIGEIVAMIGSIASRTNMLALNASIEAARAGEAGRGFAVVAQEVKALAAQTSEATGEIGRQIKAMQGTAQDAAAALTRIGGSVAEINEISASIGRAVGAQDEATARIGQSVDGAVAASRRVNAAIVDVDRATSQTGDAAAEMLTETARLADESGRLNDEVLGFIARIRAA